MAQCLEAHGARGAALAARCADALADFQQELADAYDDASERVVELHEAFDDCGGLSAAEWRAFEADFSWVDAPPAAAGIRDGEASLLPLLRFLGGASPSFASAQVMSIASSARQAKTIECRRYSGQMR